MEQSVNGLIDDLVLADRDDDRGDGRRRQGATSTQFRSKQTAARCRRIPHHAANIVNRACSIR